MKVDCQWFNTNLEAYFCDSLDAQQLQLVADHLKTCLSCRSEVQAIRDVDPMVKQLLEYRMTRAMAAAHAPRRSGRRIGFQLGLFGTAAALAGILVFAVFLNPRGPAGPVPANQTALQDTAASDADAKTDSAVPTTRAKTDVPDLKAPEIKPVPEPAITDNAPAFLVSDPAGYTRSLEDFRGHVLLIGVWSADQPEAAQSIQRLYQAFGNRKEVRILGVTGRNVERPVGMTFPMAFNNGSRILETRSSNFVVVDKEGNVQMRGSLAGDSNALTTKIRAKLDELGGK